MRLKHDYKDLKALECLPDQLQHLVVIDLVDNLILSNPYNHVWAYTLYPCFILQLVLLKWVKVRKK